MRRIEATGEERERRVSLVHVRVVNVSLGDMCDEPRPGRVRRIGVHTQTRGLIAMCERDLMGESMLAGFKGVQFGLTPAKIGEADKRDGTLCTLVNMGADAFHEIVEQSHEVGEAGNALLDPLQGANKLLPVGPSCGRLHR